MKTSSQRVAHRWILSSDVTSEYLQKAIQALQEDPKGWGADSPALRALNGLVRGLSFGNIEPFPVQELAQYLEDRGVDEQELALVRGVSAPKTRKRTEKPFRDSMREFEDQTGKSTRLIDIDLSDTKYAQTMADILKAIKKIPLEARKVWDRQVKKVVLRGSSRGSESASWGVGGQVSFAIQKKETPQAWLEYLTHELGHGMEEHLHLTVTAWDDTPYGQPPFVSDYASVNATEDFAESFRAFLLEPRLLKQKAPDKFWDMKIRLS